MILLLLLLPQRYVFSSKSQLEEINLMDNRVVIATTKVRIFKQITTYHLFACHTLWLLLLPQRYVFSSKSQLSLAQNGGGASCYCYHKGTYFQANHNSDLLYSNRYNVVIATTKVRIFKQITTVRSVLFLSTKLLLLPQRYVFSSKSQLLCASSGVKSGCYCYHKGTYFQANHNLAYGNYCAAWVVIATTKVRIFKQITTRYESLEGSYGLLLLPQRYVFSSKSQPSNRRSVFKLSCYCYHKGTYFQANHNYRLCTCLLMWLLLLPQRYVFSSKSQLTGVSAYALDGCYCYHKGTYFQANHNCRHSSHILRDVVIATTKVRIFKQITTVLLLDSNL